MIQDVNVCIYHIADLCSLKNSAMRKYKKCIYLRIVVMRTLSCMFVFFLKQVGEGFVNDGQLNINFSVSEFQLTCD